MEASTRSQDVVFPTDRTGRGKAPGGAWGHCCCFLCHSLGLASVAREGLGSMG